MIEQEWMTATDPLPMLDYMKDRASDRKWRLFLAVCARAVSTQVHDDGPVQAADVQERFADGQLTEREVKQFYRAGVGVPLDLDVPLTPAWQAARSGAYEYRFWFVGRGTTAVPFLCDVLRDIFGNPFRGVQLDPALRTPAVLGLARLMYDSKNFESMPVLGAALSDTGCTDQMVLRHCVAEGPHVRGCHLIDLLLKKE